MSSLKALQIANCKMQIANWGGLRRKVCASTGDSSDLGLFDGVGSGGDYRLADDVAELGALVEQVC
jgi:hypothetical protein